MVTIIMPTFYVTPCPLWGGMVMSHLLPEAAVKEAYARSVFIGPILEGHCLLSMSKCCKWDGL